MHLIMVGMNHRTASVELRERVSIVEDDLASVYGQLRDLRTVYESVVLSTCNRTEIYTVVTTRDSAEDYLLKYLARRAGLSEENIRAHTLTLQGEEVVRHLMKVSSGLDSMVVGETQILGQVRDAFSLAHEHGATGLILNQLFRTSIHLGKRAHTETTIGQNAVSVSYAAVQLARKVFGELTGRRVLVVGAGKMSQLTTQYLYEHGMTDVHVVNRSLARAEALAQQFGGSSVPWSSLSGELTAADIVISSTSSKQIVLSRVMVEQAAQGRGTRPLLLVDIAVPRDIDPEAGSVRNVFLYDIDDLEGVVAANQAERLRQAALVESMIQDGLSSFVEWLAEQRVVPVIAAVRARGEDIHERVMASLERKLPDLSERERKLIRKHAMSIVNQLLREPVQYMKERAGVSEGVDEVEWFADMFGVAEQADLQPVLGGLLESVTNTAQQGTERVTRATGLQPALR
ncbi:glutamyl-tRNA reductase [Alicyclobacillus sp. ALC3]|uniref:glutamyl-tRNA reductase n=1 Tax=Alicyclobacillus sp. ALC3 TaxID=2796143 RepID=UPI002379C920|nr:glutamyl-tRNA reductase [Alicyclobacillus sp. ALC3]WDL96974.1 glutamyl-tRNA reductase [Alicyclobacillus sp. ALC3]